MKCPKCTNNIELDEMSNQYYCEDCNILYDREDLETRVTIPILFLSFLMWIPIVNILITKLIDKRPFEERKVYYNIFLSSLLLHMLLLGLFAFGFKWYKETEIRFARQTLQEAAEVLLDEATIVEESRIPDILEIRQNIISQVEQKNLEKEKNNDIFSTEMITVLNGAIISGEHVRYLVERYPNYGYLIQTKSLRAKNQNINIYFNVGRYIKECEGDDIRTIDCSLYDTFSIDIQSTGYEMLDEKKTIYYIYNTEMFRVQYILNSNEEIIGMSFSELEV